MSAVSRCLLLVVLLLALFVAVSAQSNCATIPPYTQGAVCNGTVITQVYGIAMNKCAVQCCQTYSARGCKFYNYLNVANAAQSTCQFISSCPNTIANSNAAWGTYNS